MYTPAHSRVKPKKNMLSWLLRRNRFTSPTPPPATVSPASKEHSSAYKGRPVGSDREVGEYKFVKTIGRGSSGHVKLAVHKITGEPVAVKIVSRKRLRASTTVARAIERELAVLQLLDHPHLIDLKHVLQDRHHIYFIMEYVEGGELLNVLYDAKTGLPESQVRALFVQLATGLAWCHAHHICHRDLKLENVLLDRHTRCIKIADFGMAAMQPATDPLKTSCGSPHYASPEIVRGKPYYGPPIDVWSAGVMLYALLTGWLPFDDPNMTRLLMRIKTGRYRKMPETLSEGAKDLVRRMLTVDPAKRITMEQVLMHPWMTAEQEKGSFSTMLPTPPPARIKIPGIVDGRDWETLKVLWRNIKPDAILWALKQDGLVPRRPIIYHIIKLIFLVLDSTCRK
ncbi:kinase-like domain-containing protein [Syncephalastrum racemosum]|uniref:Kinase-like domain-containing protein n=1 Tax=Syncephalastrum racemosum TaxID=13706 RepID=A0A1X2HEE4_SYNRA|nr:kinase-like domain-containing protein [Syncephalastrum racemosum]